MLSITTLLFLGSLHQLCAEPRQCTKDDYCIPVPVGTCKKSLCQSFYLNEFAAFGEYDTGIRVFTWNIGQKPYIRYCPLTFTLESSETYNGIVSVIAGISLNSGPYCNISTPTTKPFSFKPDQYSPGKVTEFALPQAGDTYEGCFIYFKPGEAIVYRSCKVDPAPPQGEECASIYVFEAAKANCSRDSLTQFLQTLGVEFPQIEVDCL